MAQQIRERNPLNHAQLSATVKGKDPRHRIRIKRKSFWWIQFGYALMVLFILLASMFAMIIIAEFLRTFSGD